MPILQAPRLFYRQDLRYALRLLAKSPLGRVFNRRDQEPGAEPTVVRS